MMHYVSAVQSRRAIRVSLGPLSLSSNCMLLNFTGFYSFIYLFILTWILISSLASGRPNILIQCGTVKEGVTTRVCAKYPLWRSTARRSISRQALLCSHSVRCLHTAVQLNPLRPAALWTRPQTAVVLRQCSPNMSRRNLLEYMS